MRTMIIICLTGPTHCNTEWAVAAGMTMMDVYHVQIVQCVKLARSSPLTAPQKYRFFLRQVWTYVPVVYMYDAIETELSS